MLLSQYESRNKTHHALNADQREAGAAEMAAVMRALASTVKEVLPSPDSNFIAIYGEWNLAMREGRRPVTFKVPPGPAYGGLKLREPEFKDDPTVPRGKGPRHTRSPAG